MITILWAALIGYIALIIIPAAVLVAYLSGHRNPTEFDVDPSIMDNTCYAPWREEILESIRKLRGRPHEDIHMQSADGVSLCAQLYPGGSKTAILVHGYRSTPINNFPAIANAFLDAGWTVITPMMRGHMRSGGRMTLGPTEARDVLQWAEWADRQIDCTDIAVYGISMGGSAVVFAAADAWPEKVRALIAEACYHNLEQQMRALPQMRLMPKPVLFPLIRLFTKWAMHVDIQTDGLEILRRAQKPMCFIKAMRDESVSADVVDAAYRACGSAKKLICVEGAPHTLAFLVGGAPMQAELFDFINKSIQDGGDCK